MKTIVIALFISTGMMVSCGRDNTNTSGTYGRVPESKTTENITKRVARTEGARSGAVGVGTGSSYGSFSFGHDAAQTKKQDNYIKPSYPDTTAMNAEEWNESSREIEEDMNVNNETSEIYIQSPVQSRTKTVR